MHPCQKSSKKRLHDAHMGKPVTGRPVNTCESLGDVFNDSLPAF